MSFSDYIDLVNALREDNISIGTSLKFKQASLSNAYYFIGQFSLSALLGYFGGRFVLGPFRKLPAQNKMLFPLFFLIFAIDLDRRVQRLVPRRLYTEILTSEGADGEYIRSTLAEKTPNLWSFLSKQLHDLDYHYSEMQEETDKIPTSLIL